MNTKRLAKFIAVCAVWILVWGILSVLVGKELLLPSPLAVLKRLAFLIGEAAFWTNIARSLIRIMAGYFAALALGTALGYVTAQCRLLDDLLTPAARVIRATPVASFIMLHFVFAAKNNIPAVTSFLMVLPVVWLNIYEGTRSCDIKLLEMAKVFNLSRASVLKNIYVPELSPFFTAAAKGGIGLAWKAGIAAEVLVNPKFGIGTMLYESKVYLETADLFAWTLVVIIISIILEKLIVKYLFGRITK
ncbi:MAG: ABC transporter permease subunit [Firmicutes bacterium]|nr:ABC transporter permease subunit [Bacillota bacterium]